MAAGNAVIGALRVVLGADTAEFEKGLKSATLKLGLFAGLAAGAGQEIARGLGDAFSGILNTIPKTINEFDNLAKSSQRIGVPVEQLSALRYAAQLSDVSAESLDKSLGKLARTVVTAAQGSGEAVAAFRALGINFRDAKGNIKPVGDLLPQIADRFAAMEDGTKKTALAMQIFGRDGASLIPLLNSGAAGLKAASDEARIFGIVVSTEAGKQAEQFNDNLTRLGTVTKGVFATFTANILPALARFSDFLVEGAKNSGFVEAASNALTTAFSGIARAAILVYDNFAPIVKIGAIFVGAQIGAAAISFGLAFVKMAAAIRATTLVMGAFELVRGISMRGILFMAGIVALAAGAFDNFSESIGKIGDWMRKFLPEGSGEKVQSILSGMGLNLQGLTADLKAWQAASGDGKKPPFDPEILKTSKDALDKFISSKEKQIAVFKAEAGTIALSAVAQERAKFMAEGLAAATEAHIPITERLKLRLGELADTWSRWNIAANFGRQVFEQTRTPAEQFASTIERLNIAMQSGAIDADTYARGVAQAQDRLVQANPYAQALGNSLTSAFDRAIQGGQKLSDVLKGLLQDLARAMANQAFKTLLFGNAGMGGGSAGILGSIFGGGAGMPMNILPGFASGGSFMVGGSGGIDSQLVAFRASPDERVTVSKNGQGNGIGGALTVRVSLDNALLRAVVVDESNNVVAQAAPSIINAATSNAVGAVARTRSNSPGYLASR